MMTKLLYILPEYKRGAHTHFSYIPGFLSQLASSFEILLLVERGDLPAIPGVQSARAGFFSLVKARLAGYSICYVHYSFRSAFLASIVFRVTGGKIFYWNCGLPWQYSRSVLRDTFERFVYRTVSYVVTGTEGLANQYAKHYGISRAKVLVMPNWIDLESIKYKVLSIQGDEIRKEFGIREGQRMVLFAHRLSPRKGAQYLLEIAQKLPDNATLVVVGDGPLRVSVERGAKSEALEGQIKFLGWMPHDRVLSYMGVADIFIMPSDEEGFPHVLLEAMALGVPFVATNVGGVPEMVPPLYKAELIPRGDMIAFSARLEALLLLSDDARKARANEMAEWVKRYDIQVVAGQFIELVKTV